MINVKNILLVTLFFLMVGCEHLQVARDLEHAENKTKYLAAVASSEGFGLEVCKSPLIKKWFDIEFNVSQKSYMLPNDLSASAICLELPDGTQSAQVQSFVSSAATYYESTIVHPSLLLLDDVGGVVKDIQVPKYGVSEDFFRGMKLFGNVVFKSEFNNAKYLVVYVHPESLKGAVTVQTGVSAIPVPYNPYGSVRVKFH